MSKASRSLNLTPDERRALKGAIRRAFRQSPRMRDVLNKARVELPPAPKKDGLPGKRNQVRFICALCKDLYPGKFVQVDHVDPAVPLGVKEEDMTPNDLVSGIFCDPSNLQVLCSTPIKSLPKGSRSCHAKKTNKENFIRKGLLGTGGTLEEWSLKYEAHLAEKESKRIQKLEKKQGKQNKRLS